jgi:hypothetical protein
MIRMLSTACGPANDSRTVAKANLAVDFTPLGRLSRGGEVLVGHVGALASAAVWTVGTVFSSAIPAIMIHLPKGILTARRVLQRSVSSSH